MRQLKYEKNIHKEQMRFLFLLYNFVLFCKRTHLHLILWYSNNITTYFMTVFDKKYSQNLRSVFIDIDHAWAAFLY